MSSAPISYALTQEQALRLEGYVQSYRRHAYASQLPGRERNRALRLAQHVQGQLAERLAQGSVPLSLVLSDEERGILQSITGHLLALSARQRASAGQLATIQDLRELQSMLQREHAAIPGQNRQDNAQRSLHHA